MRFTKKEVERIRQDLSGLTETLDDTCRAHKILGECMAMCRRWNSLLDLEAENAELKAEIERLRDNWESLRQFIGDMYLNGKISAESSGPIYAKMEASEAGK